MGLHTSPYLIIGWGLHIFKLLELYLEGAIQKSTYLEKNEEIEEREKELEKKKEEITHSVPYIDKALIVQNVRYFSELAKDRIEKVPPNKLQEFLRYLIDEITFDSDRMEAKISGHILVVKKMDGPGDERLFHSPPGLAGEISNKNLRFELQVKV